MDKYVLFPLSLVALITIVGIIGAIAPLYLGEFEALGNTQLKKFASYEELKSFLNVTSHGGPYYRPYDDQFLINLSPLRAQYGLSTEGTQTASTVPDFSATNIQVEGVDEADIVKTDGEYIYFVSNDTVYIVKAYPAEEAEVLSQIKPGGTLFEIFINGDKLVLFELMSGQTFVKVFDVSNRENPTQTRNASADGYYLNSRMIGDYVYAIINQPAYYSQDKDEVTLPKITSNDWTEEISASDIYYSNITDYYSSLTTIVAIDVQNDEQEPTYQPFLFGATRNLYVSTNNIYITLLNATYSGQFGITREFQRTIIHRIHVENEKIEYVATGEVQGYVLNQFSMDEHNGYFRVATTTGQVWSIGEGTSRNHVYILDSRLDIVGKLEDLAPGEKIYSARFMGNRGYLVTFKKIDPLFVIDLSDPFDPRVLGELKITGYSDYLHPYDENHIIGIGKETAEAEQGNFAWYQGIKISLFDVTDVTEPKEIDKYEIGDRGTDSPILYDHKAFLFDKEKNLLVIPVAVAEIDSSKYPGGNPPSNAYGEFVWDGAYVFHISLERGLELQGRITHLNNDSELLKSRYYSHSPYSVKRSLYIGDVLYTVSDSKITMNSLLDLTEINELNFNQ